MRVLIYLVFYCFRLTRILALISKLIILGEVRDDALVLEEETISA